MVYIYVCKYIIYIYIIYMHYIYIILYISCIHVSYILCISDIFLAILIKDLKISNRIK